MGRAATDVPSLRSREDRACRVAAVAAAVLGVASAAVSAYWAAGGDALLDTVGGEIEAWGRRRTTGVVLALWVVTAAKLVGATAPLLFAGRGPLRLQRWFRRRPVRVLGWLAAVGLAAYGAVLTVGGMLVVTGVIHAAPDADRHAIAWHTWCWDPWFALWGAAFTTVMWRSRAPQAGDVRRAAGGHPGRAGSRLGTRAAGSPHR